MTFLGRTDHQKKPLRKSRTKRLDPSKARNLQIKIASGRKSGIKFKLLVSTARNFKRLVSSPSSKRGRKEKIERHRKGATSMHLMVPRERMNRRIMFVSLFSPFCFREQRGVFTSISALHKVSGKICPFYNETNVYEQDNRADFIDYFLRSYTVGL